MPQLSAPCGPSGNRANTLLLAHPSLAHPYDKNQSSKGEKLKKQAFLLIAAFLCMGLSVSSLFAQAPTATFRMLDVPVDTWVNYAISADGSVMAANVGGEIFRWTSEQGFVDLGAGNFLNSSIGISADGSTIAATIVGPDGLTNPGRWQAATGWMSLGHPVKGCSMVVLSGRAGISVERRSWNSWAQPSQGSEQPCQRDLRRRLDHCRIL